MKKEYDLSQMKSRSNPYAKQLNRQVTINTEVSVIEYFKKMAKKSGTSYQNLINLYLKDCVNSNREVKI
ncbi:MAG: antitoxin [Sulfurovum sp.]